MRQVRVAPLKLPACHYGKWVLGTQRGQVGTCVRTPSHRTGVSGGSPQRKMEVGSKATGEVGVGSGGAMGWGCQQSWSHINTPCSAPAQCAPSSCKPTSCSSTPHIPLRHSTPPHPPVQPHTPIPPYLQCSPIPFISPNLSVL